MTQPSATAKWVLLLANTSYPIMHHYLIISNTGKPTIVMYEEGLCFPGNIEHLKLSYIVTGETSNECYVNTEKVLLTLLYQ